MCELTNIFQSNCPKQITNKQNNKLHFPQRGKIKDSTISFTKRIKRDYFILIKTAEIIQIPRWKFKSINIDLLRQGKENQ